MEISIDTIDTTALTKAKLSEMLFEQLGLNMREARDFVDAFYEEISKGLISGREVKIAGFGNFEVHNKSARPGRNPRTGKEVTIPLLDQPDFTLSSTLYNLALYKQGVFLQTPLTRVPQ